MWEYNYNDTLTHHGIKGQEWGVRRFQNEDGSLTAAGEKRYLTGSERKAAKAKAKEDYKNAKKAAKENFRKATERADSQYEKQMAEKESELAKIEKEYDDKDAATERYYESQIDKHRRDAEEAEEEMNFWDGKSDMFYREAEARYLDSATKIEDLEITRDSKLAANRIERDNANIKVEELYADKVDQASSSRMSAYTKAGEDYIKSLMDAKKTYKETKKSIKQSK